MRGSGDVTSRLTARRRELAETWRGWNEARRHDLSHVQRFVIFAGWPRSAHSLVGSVLTAHPDAAVAHELDALSYVDREVSRRVLFGLLLRKDRLFAEAGSEWTDYSYAIPGQWQGRYRELRIIGDKKGGRTSQQLFAKPELLDQLRRTVEVPVQVIVVTRHPLDNIARMVAERAKVATPDESIELLTDRKIERFFTLANAVAWLSNHADVHWMAHEEFLADPTAHLADLVRVLELDPDPAHLASAAGIVNESPRLAREAIPWSDGRAERVMERAADYPFFARYLDG